MEPQYNFNDDYSPQEPTASWGSHIVEFIQTLAVFAAIGAAVYYFVAQPHKVSGPSMHPTFKNGDYILTDKVTYRFSEPKLGDVVVFKNPRDESQDFIKRVMGTPGDKVKIQNRKVYVNDQLQKETYLDPKVETDPHAFMPENVEVTVEPGRYLVFGDNRLQSSDSREWGFITKSEIIGKVFFRYWPWESFGLFDHDQEFKGEN